MVRKLFSVFLVLFLTVISAQAQLREIPPIVKETFEKQYAQAEAVEYKDMLTSVQVHFTENNEKYIAKYSNKGVWKETEKEWNFGHLDEAVKDGFSKSKYADWEVEESKIVYRAGNNELYRIRVKKNDLQKKYLYFNGTGRLLEDAVTL
jgi:hypothetical protein